MKRLLIVGLLAPMVVLGQKTTLFQTVTDRFTGEKTKSLIQPITVKAGGATVLVDLSKSTKHSETVDIMVTGANLGCTLRNHMVVFLFSDSSTFSAYNSVEDCKGMIIIFINDGPTMNRSLGVELETGQLVAVRITTDDGNFDFNIPALQAKRFQKAALEFFGGADSGMGIPIDSTAPVPKKAALPPVSKQ
jgi:hypothetical protein